MANIELPKDAEGREIPLDVEVLYDEYGEKFLTDRATYMRKSGSWWFSGHFDLQSVQHRYMASRLHLTQPDSWEKLEEDVNLGCRDYCEKHRLEECDYNMRVHMLDRAKKLAGIEEAER